MLEGDNGFWEEDEEKRRECMPRSTTTKKRERGVSLKREVIRVLAPLKITSMTQFHFFLLR